MIQFSVLLSVYAREKPAYLSMCLDSIWCAQDVKPTEIVLVQDGPLTEELDRVIDTWRQEIGDSFKIIRLTKNQGTGIAKNIGLQHCTYEWVAIMDTDDIAMPNRFSKQINYLLLHPHCDMLGGQAEEITESGQTRIKWTPISDKEIRDFGCYRNPFTHVTLFFKKDLAVSVGGYCHHLYMEDYNICLRMLVKAKEVHNLPDVLVRVRVNEDTMYRRRGLIYLKSEWQLVLLKRKLHIQSWFLCIFYFLLRGLPRLLPGFLITYIYCMLRRK